MNSNIIIRPIENTDIPYIYSRLGEVFDKTNMSNADIWFGIGYSKSMSVVIEVDSQLAGFYFLRSADIPPGGVNEEIFHGLRGLEGVALGVFKEFRNQGIGKRLLEYGASRPNVDYKWGYVLKSLDNRDQWLSRAKIYYEDESMYIFYQIYNPSLVTQENNSHQVVGRFPIRG